MAGHREAVFTSSGSLPTLFILDVISYLHDWVPKICDFSICYSGNSTQPKDRFMQTSNIQDMEPDSIEKKCLEKPLEIPYHKKKL